MTKVDFKKRGETNSKLRCDGAWNDVTQRVTLFQVLVQVSSRYCVYQQFFFLFFPGRFLPKQLSKYLELTWTNTWKSVTR